MQKRTTCYLTAICLVLLTMIIAAPTALANNADYGENNAVIYYVSPNSSDAAGSGTKSAPWQTPAPTISAPPSSCLSASAWRAQEKAPSLPPPI